MTTPRIHSHVPPCPTLSQVSHTSHPGTQGQRDNGTASRARENNRNIEYIFGVHVASPRPPPKPSAERDTPVKWQS